MRKGSFGLVVAIVVVLVAAEVHLKVAAETCGPEEDRRDCTTNCNRFDVAMKLCSTESASPECCRELKFQEYCVCRSFSSAGTWNLINILVGQVKLQSCGVNLPIQC